VEIKAREKLVVKVYLSKYASNKNLCLASTKLRYSDSWNRLSSIKVAAANHILWILGRGDLNFWYDSWFNAQKLNTLARGEILNPNLIVREFSISLTCQIFLYLTLLYLVLLVCRFIFC
jgi:hypothetical protein